MKAKESLYDEFECLRVGEGFSEKEAFREILNREVRSKFTDLMKEIEDERMSPPFDLKKVAEDLVSQDIGEKIEVIEEDLARAGYVREDFDNDDGKIIHIDKDAPTYRKNFTLAHEIGHIYGHLIMKRNKIVELRKNLEEEFLDNIVENVMDDFAGSLLMPKGYIEDIEDEINNNLNYDTLMDISKKFSVSKQSLIIRLNELDILEHPNIIILFKNTFYFDKRKPEKMNRDRAWRVYCRSTPSGLFIPVNAKAASLGFDVDYWEEINRSNFAMQDLIKIDGNEIELIYKARRNKKYRTLLSFGKIRK